MAGREVRYVIVGTVMGRKAYLMADGSASDHPRDAAYFRHRDVAADAARDAKLAPSYTKSGDALGMIRWRVEQTEIQSNPLTASLSYSRKPKVRENPTLAILNPGGRLARARTGAPKLIQSERVYEIWYRHVDDKQDYHHKFAAGVQMYCLEDGAILLQRNDGKPLWEDFD